MIPHDVVELDTVRVPEFVIMPWFSIPVPPEFDTVMVPEFSMTALARVMMPVPPEFDIVMMLELSIVPNVAPPLARFSIPNPPELEIVMVPEFVMMPGLSIPFPLGLVSSIIPRLSIEPLFVINPELEFVMIPVKLLSIPVPPEFDTVMVPELFRVSRL